MSNIEVQNLCRHWGDIFGVHDVSFHVPEKSFTVLLGPSGCGKSTLLRMICGLEEVSSGHIYIGGKEVTHSEASQRDVSMVFQSYALFPHLSVKENIQFGLKVRRVPTKEREERIRHAAEIVGLSDVLNRKPAQLSGGQCQRVALARSIVSEKTICLMDEPLSNLDAKLRAEMRDQLRSLQQRLGLTVVYVTHDQVEAMSMADQIILLQKGKIEQVSTPERLYNYPNNMFAAQFVGMPPMNILKLDHIEQPQLCQAISAKIQAYDNATYLGIRPEQMRLHSQGLSLDVFAVDYFGGETVIRGRHINNDIYIRIARQPHIKIGDKIFIDWEAEDMHLFDKNEQCIEK